MPDAAASGKIEGSRRINSSKSTTTDKQWYPAIDGLRAIAVFLVLTEHWAFFLVRDLPPLVRPGRFGVQLFFVISGFLITQIILKSVHDGQREPGANLRFLRSFYARRFLRIFPLYYAVLFIAVLLGVQEIRDRAAWHFTYTSNVYDSIFGVSGSYGHFWSLCVEEQFYIVWPFTLVLFRQCRGLAAILLALLLYPSTIIGLSLAGVEEFITASPLGCLHTLGGGSLLAWLSLNANAGVVYRTLLSPQWLFMTFAAYSAFVVFGSDPGCVLYLAHHLLMALFLTACVAWASDSQASRLRKVLENPALQYCGKISYGIYVIHPFVPEMIRWVFAKWQLNAAASLGKLQLPVFFIVTIAIASTSWYLMESPINRLKSRFPYIRSRVVATE